MATSKSTSKRAAWVGGASVFSGRPDPTWEVKPSVAKYLERIWRALKPVKRELPPIPALGYRGCFLQGSRNREWFAFGGLVTLRSANRSAIRSGDRSTDHSQSRADPTKKFERALLSSAPEGLLPPWLEL